MAFQSGAFQSGAFQIDGGATEVTGSLTAAAIILSVRQASVSFNGVIGRSFTGSVGLEASINQSVQASLAAEAVVQSGRQASFSVEAWILLTEITGSFAAASVIVSLQKVHSTLLDAYIEGALRMRHDRGGSPHHDFDPDTVITLAKSIGVYQQGMDLHFVLAALVARVDDLEAN